MALAAAAIKAHFGNKDGAGGGDAARAARMFEASRSSISGGEGAGPPHTAPAATATTSSDDIDMRQSARALDAMLRARQTEPRRRSTATDDASVDGDGDGGSQAHADIATPAPPQATPVRAPRKRKGDEIPSVPDQRILAIVNAFVAHATGVVNRVCALSEERLAQVDRGIRRLEVTMRLLEIKVASAEGGAEGGQTVSDAPQEAAGAAGSASGTEEGTAAAAGAAQPSADAAAEPETKPAEEEAPAAPSNGVEARNHPSYSKYFKMLAVGVGESAQSTPMRPHTHCAILRFGDEWCRPRTDASPRPSPSLHLSLSLSLSLSPLSFSPSLLFRVQSRSR